MENLTSSKRIVIKVMSAFLAIFIVAFNIYPIISVSAEYQFSDIISNSDIHRKHSNNYMKIALTFDDGPHPKYTPQILEILKRYDIKATFFTVGINAFYYQQTLKMIIDSGHEIGNHTYTHPRVNCIRKENLMQEIEKCEDTIYSLTDYRTKLFRPPEGMIDSASLNILRDLDYSVILWDIDTRDWAHTPANEIAENVIKNISSGDIILMHDYIGTNSPTCAALEIFVPELIRQGYNFVVVSELIGSG